MDITKASDLYCVATTALKLYFQQISSISLTNLSTMMKLVQMPKNKMNTEILIRFNYSSYLQYSLLHISR